MSREVDHVFERLRQGAVPDRGLEHFAIGIDKARAELRRQMDLASQGEGAIKFLRGEYGCGKTFMSRLTTLDAQERNFATSFVVVSDNDLHFYKFDDVYRKVMSQLATKTCPRAAFGDILDQWIGKIEDALIELGEDEDADDFDQKVHKRLEEDIQSLTGGQAPDDFIRVIQSIFRLKQEGNYTEAGALLSWLSGSGNVASSAKKFAQIKGDISSRHALDYLRGVLAIIKAVGYKGLVIVIDEVETVLRMRSDIRNKSLNGLRQIHDATSEFPGLLWIFTGTREFFDNRTGVAGLEPLHQRIRFQKHGDHASLRQPQLRLTPFDKKRLKSVAIRLREMFPSNAMVRIKEKVSDVFIEQLVEQITEGFHGDVGIVPRQFLRDFVGMMDLVDENESFDPMKEYKFSIPEKLSDCERAAIEQTKLDKAVAGEDDLIATEDAW